MTGKWEGTFWGNSDVLCLNRTLGTQNSESIHLRFYISLYINFTSEEKSKYQTEVFRWNLVRACHLLSFFFCLWPCHMACRVLVSPTGIEAVPPAVEAQSLNHWTTREVPAIYFFFFLIYFWLHWIFVAACGLSLVAASKGYSTLRCAGFSLW